MAFGCITCVCGGEVVFVSAVASRASGQGVGLIDRDPLSVFAGGSLAVRGSGTPMNRGWEALGGAGGPQQGPSAGGMQ